MGLLLVLPVVIFGLVHIKNAHDRPNRRAVKVGYLLFATSLVVLVTGVLLTRVDIFQFKNVGLKDPTLALASPTGRTSSRRSWRSGFTFCTGLPGPRIKWQARHCAGARRLERSPCWNGAAALGTSEEKPNRLGGRQKIF